jgi:hypothetical protein
LENTTFNFERRQIALLGYRAICRDQYGKDAEIAAAEAMRNYVAVNPEIPGFKEKDRRHQIMRIARLNARENLSRARQLFAQALGTERIRYFGIHFADAPMYLASGAFLPEWDFKGDRLQDLSRIEDFKPICFSAWATGDQSAAVFCWHDSADAVCIPFIDSLRESQANRLANRILAMAFEYSENIVFRSDWWQAIELRDQENLTRRVISGIEDSSRTPRSLLDDGLNALASDLVAIHVGYGADTSIVNSK